MRPLTRRSFIATLAAAAGAAACSNTTDDAAPTTSPTSTDTPEPNAGSPAEDTVTDKAVAVVAKVGSGYERAAGVWAGFDPREHPTVVSFRSGGEVVGALAIEHDAADSLGATEPIDTAGTVIGSAHLIRTLNDEARTRLAQIESFDFHADLGGVDSFVMVSDADDEFLDSENADWVATYLHEMFHRYQDGAFRGGQGGQDVDGYDVSPENLRLAVIEDRALAHAIDDADDAAAETAARRFAALRLVRRAADDRIGLDDRQEMFEGTARALEHLQAGDDTSFTYHAGNWSRDLVTEMPTSGVKDTFAFGRFYASGAAVQRVVDRLGVTDIAARVEAGEFLADLLIDHLGVDATQTAELVEEAAAAYDADEQLLAAATLASEAAASEGPVFGDDVTVSAGATDPTGTDGADGEGFELTEEQIACLDAAEIPANGMISDEVFEECIGS